MLLIHPKRVPGDHSSPGTRARSIGLALALGVVVAAATASNTVKRTPAAHQPNTALPALRKLPPINALVAPTAANYRITLAEQRVTTACMAKRGLRYHPTPPANAQDLAAQAPAPFGLESLDPPATTGPGPTKPEPPRNQSEQYTRALFGDPGHRVTARGARIRVSRPANGCIAEAQQRLLGDRRVRWIQLLILLHEAEQDSRQRLDRDPDFRAANARWQQCMHQAGFNSTDPLQLLHALPPDADIRTSPTTQADIRCKHQTGYLPTAYTRLAAVQQKRLDEDPSMAADWKSLIHRQDTAARAVLNAAPTGARPAPVR